MRSFLRSKIHRATVTAADLHYEGSLSVDESLLRAADIAEFEEVQVWDVTRGSRLSTYAIAAPADSGVICANGAAAHLIQPGDLIIVAAFEWREHGPTVPPRVIRVDESNRLIGDHAEQPGPQSPA